MCVLLYVIKQRKCIIVLVYQRSHCVKYQVSEHGCSSSKLKYHRVHNPETKKHNDIHDKSVTCKQPFNVRCNN